MSDRIKALTVVLDKDYRDDSLDALVTAIRLFKGVADVKSIKSGIEDTVARTRVRQEFEKRWYKMLEDFDN